MIEILGYRITLEGIEKIEASGEWRVEGGEKKQNPNSPLSTLYPLPSTHLPLSPSLTIQPFVIIWALTLFAPIAFGQTFNLSSAVNRALEQGTELSNQRAVLAKARADLAAIEADPSALIQPLTEARQLVNLEGAKTAQKRLEVIQAVVNAYTALYESQQSEDALEAQVAFDTRSLEATRVRLQTRSGTQLDVDRAVNALATSRQDLAEARAAQPVLQARLRTLLGLGRNANVQISDLPPFVERKVNLDSLEDALDDRLPSVLQIKQRVDLADLQVRVSDNEFTPQAVLRQAKTDLENARRDLESTLQGATTTLRDANRLLLAALERIRITAQDVRNAQAGVSQSELRFRNGLISRLDLQRSQLQLSQARLANTRAIISYWKALAALSVASGTNVTGLSN